MIEFDKILKQLTETRPVFHSEADFQHALAWEIHRHHYEASVRLERRVPKQDERGYIDLWIEVKGVTYFVELKYVKRQARITIVDEIFDLPNRVIDLCRYEFWKDVQRLERISSANDRIIGIVILLTNEPLLWNGPKGKTDDAEFSVHEDRVVQGTLRWPEGKKGLPKSVIDPIKMNGAYRLKWYEYFNFPDIKNGRFKYLMIQAL